jgi:methanogenic corrinoid protein MtbC1
MSGDEIKEKILTLSHAQAQQERIINDLIQCMVDMNIEKFEDILDDYIEARGIEKTIPYIIFPFMERVGILWITNHINPAQEHLVSNIIRQKLIVGIESSTTPLDYNKTVLLFLPEGEHHEIGLLFMHFLLKNRGVKVLYIGANVPLKDVVYVAKLKKPDYNYSHLTSVAHNFNLEKFLNYMHTHLPETPLLVSGEPINNYKKKKPANVYFQHSITEVLNSISGHN